MISSKRFSRWLPAVVAVSGLLSIGAGGASAIDFPGPDPGPARATLDRDTMTLENNVLRFTWSTAGGRLRPKEFVDKLNGRTLSLAGCECFEIVMDESPLPAYTVKATQMEMHGSAGATAPEPSSFGPRSRYREGKALSARFDKGKGELSVEWTAELLDHSNYVQQYVTASSVPAFRRVCVQKVVVWDFLSAGVRSLGTVGGSPAAIGTMFCACEHPLARNEVQESASAAADIKRFRGDCLYDDESHVPHHVFRVSSVIGVASAGQLRRSFLYYLERERVYPFQPFLHYNNGSEIGCEYWAKRLQKKDAEAEQFRMRQQEFWLNNIRVIGDELVKKRNVKMDAFVHDFEWDDETLVWQFHGGYPQGFSPAAKVAAEYGAHVGVWFSPWGGYPCQPARIKFGVEMGFETSRGGLSLAGDRYYRRFNAACINMIDKYGANYFKFDGFAAGNNQPGPGPYASDVESLLRVASELRALRETDFEQRYKGRVFINATTGSWPSPFWLMYVDSIWRQGSDTGLLGKGSDRQRWITYRDNEVYHRVVRQSPLFPLNSLMIHGVFVNNLPFEGNPYDPKNPRASVVPKDVIDEIHTFFGTGTGCQEMYINPKLMTAELWDALAEAANWSRKNSDVLVDTHWIGGDPAKGEIYGFASWSKRQGIFTLRNPDDKRREIALDVGQAFELPPGAPSRYSLKSPWKRDAARPAIEVAAGKPHRFALEPFEVLVFEATPLLGK